MPWQAHLWIGERILNGTDARRVLATLGLDPRKVPDDPEALQDFADEHLRTRVTLSCRGVTKSLPVHLVIEREAGASYPITSGADLSCFALVGVQITSRYQGTLLDAGHPGGRPDPLVLDLDELRALRDAVRQQLPWPAAEVLMMDLFH